MNVRSLLRTSVVTVVFHDKEVRWTLGRAGRIGSAGHAPLPGGSLNDGVIVDVDAAARALREAPDFRGRARHRAVLALPAQRSVFRRLELPPLRGKQFADLVEREIRHEMPMLAENAYVSWQCIGAHEGRGSVFVVGVARDILDSHLAAARAAGLMPVAVDLRIIAAARAIGDADCVVANVEDAEVEIAIFRHGVPAIVRSITMTAPADEAPWAEQLGEELARTLKFYRDSHRDDRGVDELAISFVGAAARSAILAEQIGVAAGHDMSMPPLRLTLAPPEQTVCFATNVGLALKDLAA